MTDKIEFMHNGRLIAFAESSHAPDRGDLINIRKENWIVMGRTFTLDHAGSRNPSMSCIINLAGPLKDPSDG